MDSTLAKTVAKQHSARPGKDFGNDDSKCWNKILGEQALYKRNVKFLIWESRSLNLLIVS